MEHLLRPYGATREIAAASVLVLAPHPDDEVLGCAGAILRHVQSGTPVRVVVVADGALGLEGATRARHVAQRQAESRRAAGLLGYGEPSFWNIPDQTVTYGEPLIAAIGEAIGEADLVYAPSLLEIHPDHRALAMAAAEAVRRRGHGVRIAFYEVGAPLQPNVLLDITALEERKREAMRCFSSQLASQAYDEHIAGLNRFRAYTLPATVTAAEGYLVVEAQALAADPFGIYRPEHARQRALGLALDPSDLPLVSVIVRSMGQTELPEALDSLALQTYPNIEVIVVAADGGCRGRHDRCGRYPMRQVSAGRAGRSRAANLGLAEARGEFVIFLDEDDLFFPDHIARLVEGLQRRPGAKAAFAGVRVEDGDTVVDSYDAGFNPAMLMAWNHLPIHAVLFHRSLVDDGCAFDEAFDLYEDWDFWLQVAGHTAFERVAGVSAIYRVDLEAQAADKSAAATWSEARRQLWRKWLGRWDVADIEALVAEFRRRADADALAVGKAAYLEKELRGLVADMQAAMAHSQAALTATTARGDHLEQALNQLRADVAASREHAAGLESALTQVKASTSWRLTAPLRAVVDTLRGRRPGG